MTTLDISKNEIQTILNDWLTQNDTINNLNQLLKDLQDQQKIFSDMTNYQAVAKVVAPGVTYGIRTGLLLLKLVGFELGNLKDFKDKLDDYKKALDQEKQTNADWEKSVANQNYKKALRYDYLSKLKNAINGLEFSIDGVIGALTLSTFFGLFSIKSLENPNDQIGLAKGISSIISNSLEISYSVINKINDKPLSGVRGAGAEIASNALWAVDRILGAVLLWRSFANAPEDWKDVYALLALAGTGSTVGPVLNTMAKVFKTIDKLNIDQLTKFKLGNFAGKLGIGASVVEVLASAMYIVALSAALSKPMDEGQRAAMSIELSLQTIYFAVTATASGWGLAASIGLTSGPPGWLVLATVGVLVASMLSPMQIYAAIELLKTADKLGDIANDYYNRTGFGGYGVLSTLVRDQGVLELISAIPVVGILLMPFKQLILEAYVDREREIILNQYGSFQNYWAASYNSEWNMLLQNAEFKNYIQFYADYVNSGKTDRVILFEGMGPTDLQLLAAAMLREGASLPKFSNSVIEISSGSGVRQLNDLLNAATGILDLTSLVASQYVVLNGFTSTYISVRANDGKYSYNTLLAVKSGNYDLTDGATNTIVDARWMSFKDNAINSPLNALTARMGGGNDIIVVGGRAVGANLGEGFDGADYSSAFITAPNGAYVGSQFLVADPNNSGKFLPIIDNSGGIIATFNDDNSLTVTKTGVQTVNLEEITQKTNQYGKRTETIEYLIQKPVLWYGSVTDNFSNTEWIKGSLGSDVFKGNSKPNFFVGTAGKPDRYDGGGGIDWLDYGTLNSMKMSDKNGISTVSGSVDWVIKGSEDQSQYSAKSQNYLLTVLNKEDAIKSGMNHLVTSPPTVHASSESATLLWKLAFAASMSQRFFTEYQDGSWGHVSQWVPGAGYIGERVGNPGDNFRFTYEDRFWNYLVVDGAAGGNKFILSDDVEFRHGEDYLYEYWVKTGTVSSPNLQLFVDDGGKVPVGVAQSFALRSEWQKVQVTFKYTGSPGMKRIGLVNLNTATDGNDFLLEDFKLWRTSNHSKNSYSGNNNGMIWKDDVSNIENVRGGRWNDYIIGSSQDNIIIGNEGDDKIYGLAGNDAVATGQNGNAFIDGGDGVDGLDYSNLLYSISVTASDTPDSGSVVKSGGGRDTYENIEYVRGGALNDTFVGSVNPDVFDGSAGNDSFNTAGGNDYVLTGGGKDTVNAGAGDDTIIVEKASAYDAKTIDGGDGVDTVDYQRLVKVNLLRNGDFDEVMGGGDTDYYETVGAGSVSRQTTAPDWGFKTQVGYNGPGDTFLVVDSATTNGKYFWKQSVNLVAGTTYRFSYMASGGGTSAAQLQFYMDGQAVSGATTTLGLSGGWQQVQFDFVAIKSGSVLLGMQNLNLTGWWNDFLLDKLSLVSLDASTGLHADLSNTAAQRVTYAGTSDSLKDIESLGGTQGHDTIVGSDGDNRLWGYGGDDNIDARGGNDVIITGTGKDTVSAGAGDDTIIVDKASGNDVKTIDGGDGVDTVDYQQVRAAQLSGIAADLLNTEAQKVTYAGASESLKNIENLGGTQGNDTIVGSDGDNRLWSYGGDDNINARGGNDLIITGAGKDTVNAGAGDDTIIVEKASAYDAKTIDGGDGVDTVDYQQLVKVNLLRNGDFDEVMGGGDTDYYETVGAGSVSRQTTAPDWGFKTQVGYNGPGDTFLVVNSATTNGKYFWKQSVNLVAGTTYRFSYMASGGGTSAAQLQFYMDGQAVSGATTTLGLSGGWQQVQFDFVAIKSGSVLLGMQNLNLTGWWNDFLLDKLSLVSLDASTGLHADLSNTAAQRVTYAGTSDSLKDIESLGGTQGHDTIVGSDGDNRLWGYGGDDNIDARGGNDVIITGTGKDTVSAGAGDDTIIVDKASGNDVKTIDGGDGVDTVDYQQVRAAQLSGIAADLLNTEAQKVTYAGASESLKNIENLGGTQGNDTIVGSDGDNRLWSYGGDDNINARGGNDVIITGAGKDTVNAGAGDDTIIVEKASAYDAKTIDGGDGVDTVDYQQLVKVNLLRNGDFDEVMGGGDTDYYETVGAGSVSRQTTAPDWGFKTQVGYNGPGDTFLVVNSATTNGKYFWKQSVNLVAGTTYRFSYMASGGGTSAAQLQFYMDGQAVSGATTTLGLSGGWQQVQFDFVAIKSGSVLLGMQNLNLTGWWNDFLLDKLSLVSLDASTGLHADLSNTAAQRVTYAGTSDGLKNIEILGGTQGHDTIVGSDGDNRLWGYGGDDNIDARGGNDVIITGTGKDTVSAGAGDDTIIVDKASGNDVKTIDGGDGVDTVDYQQVRAAQLSGIAADLLNTAAQKVTYAGASESLKNIENLGGTHGNDKIVGSDGDNRLWSYGGDDNINARGGNDVIITGAGKDTVNAGAGDDTIIVEKASAYDAKTIDGGDGVDTVDYQQLVKVNLLRNGDFDEVMGGGDTDYYETVGAGSVSRQTTAPDWGFKTQVGYNGPGDTFLVVNSATTNGKYFWKQSVNLVAGTTYRFSYMASGGGTSAAQLQFYMDGQAVSGATTTLGLSGGWQQVQFDFVAIKSGSVLLGMQNLNLTGWWNDFLLDKLSLVSLDASTGLHADLSNTAAQRVTYAGTSDGLKNIEILGGTQGHDTIVGSDGDNRLWGYGGDDNIDARGGNDVIITGTGKDTVSAGAGDDTIIVDKASGNDVKTIDGGDGVDTVDYQQVRAAQLSGIAADLLNTAAQKVTYAGASESLKNIENLGGTHGNDKIVGSDGDNRLWSYGGDDNINARGGNDVIITGAGKDTVNAGAGDDTIIVEKASAYDAKTIDGGDGVDTVDYQQLVKVNLLRNGDFDEVMGGGDTDYYETVGAGSVSRQTTAPDWGFKTQVGYNGPGDTFLVVNSATTNGKYFWKQSVNLVAGTTYRFSYMASGGGTSAAQLQFYMDGQAVSGATTTLGLSGGWQQVQFDFVAIKSGSVLLGMQNLNLTGWWNDFLLDKLSLVSLDASTGLHADLSNTAAQRVTYAGTSDGLKNIENLGGTHGNDKIVGSDGDNRLWGYGGDDNIDARGGNDVIITGIGKDTVSASGGDDTIIVDHAAPPMLVRYIMVMQERSLSQRMCVSEIEVFSGGRNVALGKTVTANPNYALMAGYALNEVTDGLVLDNSGYATTNEELQTLNWLQIDLGQNFQVDSVNLHALPGYASNGNGLAVFALQTDMNVLSKSRQPYLYQFKQGAYNSKYLGTSSGMGATGAQSQVFDTSLSWVDSKTIDGGDGVDTVDYQQVRVAQLSGIAADLSNTAAQKVTYQGASDSLKNIENLAGTQGHDTIVGSAGDNRLWGYGGNDNIDSGGGNDLVVTGAGHDTVKAGSGNDSIYVEHEKRSFDGVSYSQFLKADLQTIASNFSIDRIDLMASDFVLGGGSIGRAIAKATRIDRSIAGKVTFWAEGLQGTQTKAVKIELSDTGNGVVKARILKAAYCAGDVTLQNFDWDNDVSKVRSVSVAASDTSNGYGLKSMVLKSPGFFDKKSIDGGDGTDFVSYRFSSVENARPGATGITADLRTGQVHSWRYSNGTVSKVDVVDALTNIENLGGTEYGDTLYGNSGNNILAGYEGNDVLNGISSAVSNGVVGNDILLGGAGSDTYQLDANWRSAVIVENPEKDSASDSDWVNFNSNINYADLWFSKNGDHLVVNRLATGDRLVVQDWYSADVSKKGQVEQFNDTIGGKTYVASLSRVESLVNTLAKYKMPTTTIQNSTLTGTQKAEINQQIAKTWLLAG